MRSEVLRRAEHVLDTYSGRACGSLADLDYWRLSNASHAARRVACHGVRSHAVPVALVGECSIPGGGT